MEVFRVTLLSLVLCVAYMPYAVQGDQPPIYGKVGEEIVLACPKGEKETGSYRTWYKGKYDGDNPGPDAKLIYRGKDTDTNEGVLFRSEDMKIDPSTFTLTLTVQKTGIDNGYFTCVTQKSTDLYDIQEVLIFLQPNITIVTDKQPAEGVNVTVICTIERVFPNITEEQFKMKWNNQATYEPVFSGERNDDYGSMKYTLERMKNLTRDDDGAKVECTVTPTENFGEPDTKSLILNFTMGPTTPPSGGGGASVGTTIGRIISGLAAVVILLAISDSGLI